MKFSSTLTPTKYKHFILMSSAKNVLPHYYLELKLHNANVVTFTNTNQPNLQ